MKSLRVALGVFGALVAAWGAFKLATYDLLDLRAVALWLGGGVVAHDAVLVPATLIAGLVASMLPRPWLAPAAVGAMVLGSVTLLAVPVLSRAGELADNATLLDRNYLLGWVGFAAVTVVAVLLAGLRRRSSEPSGSAVGDVPATASVTPRAAGRIGDP